LLHSVAIGLPPCLWRKLSVTKQLMPKEQPFFNPRGEKCGLAVIVGATGVTRVLGWRIEKVQSEKLSDQTGIRPRHLQFTLRTVALLVSAISVLFAINVRLKFVAVVFGSDAWTAIFLLTAISSVLALWATLGEGRLAVRLLIYASVATAGITGVIVTDPMFAKNFEVVLTYLVPDVLVIPLTLLAFRIAGYRVARQATESTNGEATVAVVSP